MTLDNGDSDQRDNGVINEDGYHETNSDDVDKDNGDNRGAGWLSERFLCFIFFPSLTADGERQTEGTDANRKRDSRSSAGHHKSEDTSDSREDEAAVSPCSTLVSGL